MTYLIVGIDRHTFGPWHQNIRAGDVTAARQVAVARAHAVGVDLVVAAVLGPYSNILPAT